MRRKKWRWQRVGPVLSGQAGKKRPVILSHKKSEGIKRYIPLCRMYRNCGPLVEKHWWRVHDITKKMVRLWVTEFALGDNTEDCRPQISYSVQPVVNIQIFWRKILPLSSGVKKKGQFNILVLGNTPVLSGPPWGTRYSYMEQGGIVNCIQSDSNTYICVSNISLPNFLPSFGMPPKCAISISVFYTRTHLNIEPMQGKELRSFTSLRVSLS